MRLVLMVGGVVRSDNLFLFIPNLAGAIHGLFDFKVVGAGVDILVIMLTG